MSKDEYDYSRYRFKDFLFYIFEKFLFDFLLNRKYVLHRMSKLKFLDCYEVTKQEKEMVSQESQFYDVVKLKDQDSMKQKDDNDLKKNDSSNQYTPLPNKNAETPETSQGKLN